MKNLLPTRLPIAISGIVLAPLLTASCVASPAPAEAEVAKKLIEIFVADLESEDFAGAAALFHYPSSYTEAERAADLAAVTEDLQILVQSYGKPAKIAPASGTSLNLEAAVGGGTISYWKGKPNMGRDLTAIYKAKFESEGEGFLNCYIFRNRDRLEFQAIGFGLPVSNPRALPLMQATMQQLYQSSQLRKQRHVS